jgi:hypothetical protein
MKAAGCQEIFAEKYTRNSVGDREKLQTLLGKSTREREAGTPIAGGKALELPLRRPRYRTRPDFAIRRCIRP